MNGDVTLKICNHLVLNGLNKEEIQSSIYTTKGSLRCKQSIRKIN